MTKKPLHAFSGFAVLAYVLALFGAWLTAQAAGGGFDHLDDRSRDLAWLGQWLGLLGGSAIYVAELLGIAILIELVDHIRWRGLTAEERAEQGARYLSARLSRWRGLRS